MAKRKFDADVLGGLKSFDMSDFSNTGPAPDSVALWLKRLVWLATFALLVCCCWFMWRISMVAYQTEAAIAAISGDVKQMSATGAQISQHLQNLDQRLRSIEQKAVGALNLDEVEHMLDEVNDIRDASEPGAAQMSPETEREIKHLLSQIRRAKHRFTYDDENKGGTRFYLQLYAKYKTYENAISSAEDFISLVATKSIAGKEYQVVIEGEGTIALKDWLGTELEKYRARDAKTVSEKGKRRWT